MGKGPDAAYVADYLKKLEKMADEMGAPLDGVDRAEEKEDDGIDMSQMTEFEKQRYLTMKGMQEVRSNITRLADHDSGKTKLQMKERARLQNATRKELKELKLATAKMKGAADAEGKQDEHKQVLTQMRKTDKMYSNCQKRRAGQNPDDDDDDDDDEGFDSRGTSTRVGGGRDDLGEPLLGGGEEEQEPLLDPADEEEFQQLYAQSRQNDQKIEEALGRVNQGLTRIKQQALVQSDVLDKQNAQLDRVTEKAEGLNARVKGLNKSLDGVLKEVEKDKFCCYMICFLLVLGVLGVLITQFDLL